ncbi:MAG: hypothetical protein IJ890_07365 [Clostridia bacterium]|nr:hypothetical protein [Clostridia bacterium]
MEFNKCPQCGSFYASTGKMCPNCAEKDTIKIQKLENYIQNNVLPETVEELSINTGIPTNDLNRYINQNTKFSGLKFEI